MVCGNPPRIGHKRLWTVGGGRKARPTENLCPFGQPFAKRKRMATQAWPSPANASVQGRPSRRPATPRRSEEGRQQRIACGVSTFFSSSNSNLASSRFWNGPVVSGHFEQLLDGLIVSALDEQDSGQVVSRVGTVGGAGNRGSQRLLRVVEVAPLVEHPTIGRSGFTRLICSCILLGIGLGIIEGALLLIGAFLFDQRQGEVVAGGEVVRRQYVEPPGSILRPPRIPSGTERSLREEPGR